MLEHIHLLGLSVSDFHRDYRISQWESEAFSLSLSNWRISSRKLDFERGILGEVRSSLLV